MHQYIESGTVQFTATATVTVWIKYPCRITSNANQHSSTLQQQVKQYESSNYQVQTSPLSVGRYDKPELRVSATDTRCRICNSLINRGDTFFVSATSGLTPSFRQGGGLLGTKISKCTLPDLSTPAWTITLFLQHCFQIEYTLQFVYIGNSWCTVRQMMDDDDPSVRERHVLMRPEWIYFVLRRVMDANIQCIVEIEDNSR